MATPVTSPISKGSGNNYYKTTVTTNADGSLSATTSRTDAKGNGAVAVQTTTVDKNGGNKKQIFGEGATAAEQKAFSDPTSTEGKLYTQQVQSVKPYGDNPTAEQKQALNGAAGKPNQATNPDGTQTPAVTPEQQKEFEDEQKAGFKEQTREEYGNVKYPENLTLEHQDCIKFSILEYRPSAAKSSSGSKGGSQSGVGRVVLVNEGTPGISGAKTLGTITLPIPAGISDSNSVDWQGDPLNTLQLEGQKIAQAVLGGGDVSGTLENAKNVATGGLQSGEVQKSLASSFANMATQSNSAQQRAFGSIFNNNLELLFNGPSLRQFSFNFKLSPREPKEAKAVMKIIRFFKQAMSVKRSKTSLLLKSPRTFAISYLTSNKQHPYLNKFKECALTGFNVDYTPEGQYMTYMSSNANERSMISYSISLTFQELEPIFDDEYGNESSSQILNVGY